MTFKKFKINPGSNLEKAQSVIEYALLVAIAVIALVLSNFILQLKNNSFESHFKTASYYIGGVIP